MLEFKTDIFKTINGYNPDIWMWLGDAAYTDDLLASCKLKKSCFITILDKKDNSMPLEHVKQRF